MRKILLAPLAFFLLVFQTSPAQHLLSSTLLVHYNKHGVDSIFAANSLESPLTPVNYGFSCYRLIYSTLNAKQTDTTTASGLLIVPDSVACPMATVMYDHGTTLVRTDVPSYLNLEALIPMILATDGYFALAPDYLGLGTSPGFHPYVHAASEAQAGIDLIFAAKEFAMQKNIQLNPQLFLTGYSQGGHACMATHRAIQENYAGQLTVTASAPGSGPYNLSGIQSAGLAQDSFYADPSYIPYLVFAYQSVYGNLYDSIPQFLQYPYDSTLPPLYNEQYSTTYVDGFLPNHVDSFIVDSQLVRYQNDSANDPLRIDLRLNDVYAWVPQAPVAMTYCTEDEQVIYQSTLFTLNYFQTHGDSTAVALNGGPNDHFDCVPAYVINMKTMFDSLRTSDNGLTLLITSTNASAGIADGSATVTVTGGIGYSIKWSTGGTDNTISGLAGGTYTVTVSNANGCPKTGIVTITGGPLGITTVTNSAWGVTLFPNPANNQVTINALNFTAETVSLYNNEGQLIDARKYEPKLDISALASGVYTIEVKGANAIARKRLVKL